MRTRDNIGAVIKSLKRDHSLLAAYLEATEKIDWRAFDEPMLIGETTPKIVMSKRAKRHHRRSSLGVPTSVKIGLAGHCNRAAGDIAGVGHSRVERDLCVNCLRMIA